MTNVLAKIDEQLYLAITKAFPDLHVASGMVQASSKFGDYKCTAPMSISQVSLISLCRLFVCLMDVYILC